MIDSCDEAALAELRSRFRGEVLAAGNEGYDAARALWNGMIDKRPTVILRVAGVADVDRRREVRPRPGPAGRGARRRSRRRRATRSPTTRS